MQKTITKFATKLVKSVKMTKKRMFRWKNLYTTSGTLAHAFIVFADLKMCR